VGTSLAANIVFGSNRANQISRASSNDFMRKYMRRFINWPSFNSYQLSAVSFQLKQVQGFSQLQS
jgi:hypothetical protein